MSYKNKIFKPKYAGGKEGLMMAQMYKPPCFPFHTWYKIESNPAGFYEQCSSCYDRRYRAVFAGGTTPLNVRWLEGGAWDG